VAALEESQRRYTAAVARYGGVTDAVAVVPAYEGPPALAFVALTLPFARQRLLGWTVDEFLVFETMGGEVPTTVLHRVRRPAALHVVTANGLGHDRWTIAGRTYKVAAAFRPLTSALDRTR
jgi:hypothetical protein